MPLTEILGYGLRFTPRMDGPTVLWQTLPPVGSNLPRMLNVGFKSESGFRWGTVIPRMKGKPAKPPGVKLLPIGGDDAWMLVNNAEEPADIVGIDDDANRNPWTLRALLTEKLAVDVSWAPLFFVETTPPGSLWPFELHGPLEDIAALESQTGIAGVLKAFDSVPPTTLVIVRGPLPGIAETLDVFETRMAEGTSIVGRGRTDGGLDWVEAMSRGENGHTIQRHFVRDVGRSECVVVTGQAALDEIDPVREYAEQVATKLAVVRRG